MTLRRRDIGDYREALEQFNECDFGPCGGVSNAYPGTSAGAVIGRRSYCGLGGVCFLRPEFSGRPNATSNDRKAGRPDCASAIAETTIGAITSGGAVALAVYAGPEIVAAAGVEATGEALLAGGEMVEAGMEVTHVLSGLGSAIAAPFTLLGHGAIQVAENCF
jgi:hypothetical protein